MLEIKLDQIESATRIVYAEMQPTPQYCWPLLCENLGTEEATLPCCVQGMRGALMVGEVCDTANGQLTCASSLCISNEEANAGYCSGECLSDDDCPSTMPRCISVAFSGSDSMWCFPPALD